MEVDGGTEGTLDMEVDGAMEGTPLDFEDFVFLEFLLEFFLLRFLMMWL